MATFRITTLVFLLSVSAASIGFVAAQTTTTTAATPTCASLGDSWYFPNACVSSCQELGSTMDLDRSRNVGSLIKCYCADREKPFCTDDPLCADLGIKPATAVEDCKTACGGGAATTPSDATIDVDYNGYQFHYVVGCSCGDGKDTKRLCGNDYVLFSDMDFMNSCSGSGDNTGNVLNIRSEADCDGFCAGTGVFTEGGIFARNATDPGLLSCSCGHSSIVSDDPETVRAALACDDATARANDGSGLGNPCYTSVGVNTVDCPDPEAADSAASSEHTKTTTKTLVSSAAIMGVWLLPW